MQRTSTLGAIAMLATLPLASARGQQPNPFGTGQRDSTRSERAGTVQPDSNPKNRRPRTAAPADFGNLDSVVYRLLPSSRLEVKTGKAGLFGFAGHSHVIRARAFSGQVVYYPKAPPRSHVEITIPTDSLEVLTPPDTAEIRKVTEAMRTEVLHVDQHPEIRLVSRAVTPSADGFHVVGALTLAGQTREVPIDVAVELGRDTVRATSRFAVKQTDFGIKPYSGGPAGTVKVADRVTFDIDAIAARGEPQAAVTERR